MSRKTYITQLFLVGILLLYFKRLDGEDDHELGKNPKGEDLFIRFLTKRRQFKENVGKHTGEQVKPVPYRMVEQWWKPVGRKGPIKVNRQPEVSAKGKIIDNKEKKYEIQKKVATKILVVSDDISQRNESTLERLKIPQGTGEDHELGKNPKGEDLFASFLRKRQQFKANVGKLTGEQVKPIPYTMVEQWWKPIRRKRPMEVNRQPWVSPISKLVDNIDKRYDIQKKVATEIFVASAANSLRNESPLENLRRHQERGEEDQELGKNPKGEDLFVRFLRKGRQFEENVGKPTGEQVKPNPYTMVEQWWKPIGRKGSMEINRETQVSLKSKISYNIDKRYDIQNKVATKIFVASDDISQRNASPLEKLRSHQKTGAEDDELGKNPKGEDLFIRFLTERRQFKENFGKLTGEQVKPVPYTMIEQWWKPVRRKRPVKRQPEVSAKGKITDNKASFHSLQKRSILHLTTELSPLTSSTIADDGGEEEPGKVIFIVKSGNTSARPRHGNHHVIKQAKEQILKKELESQDSRMENLRHLIIGGSNSRRPSDKSKSLDEKTLSNEAHLEHREETTFSPLLSDFFSTTNNPLLQGDLFETQVQILLAQLILNEHIRNLISHLIRLIKVDCRELTTQSSCGFLISKIGLVMKLYSKRKNIQEASAMLKSSLLLGKNVKNMTIASSSKMEKPSDELPKEGISQYGHGINWPLAVSVTTVIVVIISVICLIEIKQICSHRSGKRMEGTPQENRTFLGIKKKSTPENQTSASSLEKSLWLQEMYQTVDKMWKKYSKDKLHSVESTEEEAIFNFASIRFQEIPEPPPLEITELMSLLPPAGAEAEAPAPAPIPAPALPPVLPPPLPPAREPVKKASSKKLSEKETASSEASPQTESEKESPASETSPKTETSGTEEAEGTEGISKKASSEEGEGEEDEED